MTANNHAIYSVYSASTTAFVNALQGADVVRNFLADTGMHMVHSDIFLGILAGTSCVCVFHLAQVYQVA